METHKFAPVFSWIPIELCSCQTHQHHHQPSGRFPRHYITLLHLLFGSSKLPVISSSLPSVSKEHTPPCSKTKEDDDVFWGLGKAPAGNIICSHSPSCACQDDAGWCLLPISEIQSVHPPFSSHKLFLAFWDEAAPKSWFGKQQENILPVISSWEVLAGQQSSPVASCRLVVGGRRGLGKGWNSAPTLNITGGSS